MRWPRPKFTVRRAMLAVAAFACSLFLALRAIDVWRDPGNHVHIWVNPHGKPVPPGTPITPATISSQVVQVWLQPSPFWHRYVRHLLGRPWQGRPLCDRDPSRIAETCEYDHPGMIFRDGPNDVSFQIYAWPPEIKKEASKLDPGLFQPSASTLTSP